MSTDRHADREVLARAGEVVAPLVAAPIEEQLDRCHAPDELRTLLAERRDEHVLGPHGRTDPDRHGLLTERRGERSESSGALQRHRLGVEGTGHPHGPVQLDQRVGISSEVGELVARRAVGVDVGGAADDERCNVGRDRSAIFPLVGHTLIVGERKRTGPRGEGHPDRARVSSAGRGGAASDTMLSRIPTPMVIFRKNEAVCGIRVKRGWGIHSSRSR